MSERSAAIIDSELGVVITALRWFEKLTDKKFEDEGGIIEQIERDHATRNALRIRRFNFLYGS